MSYVYDGRRVIQERNGSNNPTVSYTRGNDLSGSLEGAGGIGGLLGRASGYSSGTGNWSTNHFYHADGNGNVTYLVATNQTRAASYRYDPFGNSISFGGSLAAADVYRFSSKELHVASGMYYYGERFYEPNLQRWPNQDPIGERYDANLYRFVYNSPLNYVDPDGLTGWALYPPQGWSDPSIPAMIQSPEYQQGFQEGAGQAALVGFGIISLFTPIPGDEAGIAGVLGKWFSRCFKGKPKPGNYQTETAKALNRAFKGDYNPKHLDNISKDELNIALKKLQEGLQKLKTNPRNPSKQIEDFEKRIEMLEDYLKTRGP